MFAVKCNHHRLLVDPHKVAICHWGCGAHTQNLTSQCTLTKEVPLTHYADRGFFAGLGYLPAWDTTVSSTLPFWT
jgi:hypothetical protein